MKFLANILICLFLFNAYMGIGIDKWAHFGIAGMVTAVLEEKMNLEWYEAFMAVLALSIIKEVCDDTPDSDDITAGAIGSLFYIVL